MRPCQCCLLPQQFGQHGLAGGAHDVLRIAPDGGRGLRIAGDGEFPHGAAAPAELSKIAACAFRSGRVGGDGLHFRHDRRARIILAGQLTERKALDADQIDTGKDPAVGGNDWLLPKGAPQATPERKLGCNRERYSLNGNKAVTGQIRSR